MRVEYHNNLGPIQQSAATRVVIYDSLNNPMVVVCKEGETGDGREIIGVSVAGDPDFEDILRQLLIAPPKHVIDVPPGTTLDQVRFTK